MDARHVNMSRPVVVVDQITRKVLARHENYVEAADALDLTHKHAQQIATRHYVPKCGYYLIRYEDEFDPLEDFGHRVTTPIYMAKNGRLRCFYNTKEANEATGIPFKELWEFVREGEGLGFKWGRVTRGVDALIEELGGKQNG